MIEEVMKSSWPQLQSLDKKKKLKDQRKKQEKLYWLEIGNMLAKQFFMVLATKHITLIQIDRLKVTMKNDNIQAFLHHYKILLQVQG